VNFFLTNKISTSAISVCAEGAFDRVDLPANAFYTSNKLLLSFSRCDMTLLDNTLGGYGTR
jgi:hypothetical protein